MGPICTLLSSEFCQRPDTPGVLGNGRRIVKTESENRIMEQPKSVLALGIVCTVLGAAYCVLMMVVGLMQVTSLAPLLHQSSVDMQSPIITYLIMIMMSNVVTSVLMLLAGVGMLLFKPWGRVAGLLYGAVSIFIICSMLALQFRLGEIDNEAVAAISKQGYLPSLLAMVIPCLTLYVLTRPNIRDAFRGVDSVAPAAEESPRTN